MAVALTLSLFDDEPAPVPVHPQVQEILDATSKTEAHCVLISLQRQLDAGQDKLGKLFKPKNQSWMDADIKKAVASVTRMKASQPFWAEPMIEVLKAYADARRIYMDRLGDWHFEEFTKRHNPGVATDRIAEIKVDRPWVQLDCGDRVSWMEGKRRNVGVVVDHRQLTLTDPRYPIGHVQHVVYPAGIEVLTDLGVTEKLPISRSDPFFCVHLYRVYGGDQPPVNRQEPVEATLVKEPDWSTLPDEALITQIKQDLILLGKPADMTSAWDSYLVLRGGQPTIDPKAFHDMVSGVMPMPENVRQRKHVYFQPTHRLKSGSFPVRVVERCEGSLEWISARDGAAAIGRVIEEDKEEFYSRLEILA